RQHGGSLGRPGPNTMSSAAADVAELAAALGLLPLGVLGHSLGGKVALAFVSAQANADPALRPEQAWLIDSTDEPRDPDGSAWEMLDRVRRLPDRYPSRGAAVDALVADGLELPVAQWMSSNLVVVDGEYR